MEDKFLENCMIKNLLDFLIIIKNLKQKNYLEKIYYINKISKIKFDKIYISGGYTNEIRIN